MVIYLEDCTIQRLNNQNQELYLFLLPLLFNWFK